MKARDILFHKHIESIRRDLDAYLAARYCGELPEKAVSLSESPDAWLPEEAVSLSERPDAWLPEEAVSLSERLNCPQFKTPQSRSAVVFSAPAAEAREVYIPEFLQKRGGNRDIDRILEQREESFSTMLLRLIDEKGLKDSEVYKRANIDRRLFSKIRGDEEYVPSKKTAIAFCMALHLELEEAKKLLAAAGYALSASSRFDLIVMYLMEKNEYNVQFANIVLEDYGEGTLSR